MIYISEALLYISFALLTGTLILRLVPAKYKPEIKTPAWLLPACALLIPVLSFVPIHELALRFSTEFELSYMEMLRSILADVSMGKAWIWTLLGSLGLTILLSLKAFREDKHMPKVALFILFLLIIWLGYASHASSLSAFKGLVVHSAHFLGYSVWIGILFVAGWFSQNDNHWAAFLKWFSPVAIVCVLLTLIAGFTLMTFTTPQYVNSWILPYGQMLLMKHLLILPLLLFAFTNGFLYKRKAATDSSFKPRPWLKAEGVVALLVLAATASLGQQAPPHTVRETLQYEAPSSLFTSLFRGSFSPDMSLSFTWTLEGLLMFAAALLMACGVIWCHRSSRPWSALSMGVLCAGFAYLGAMFSLSA